MGEQSATIYRFLRNPNHVQRVKHLYKLVLRTYQSYDSRQYYFRYYAALVRKMFKDKMNIKDPDEALDCLNKGYDEYFWRKHYDIMQFQQSPGGTAYQREVVPPDWVLDHWHPLEKLEYPNYFVKRECRKKQFIEFWTFEYGLPETPTGKPKLLKKKPVC